MAAGTTQERTVRVADLVGEHTQDVCLLSVAYSQGRLGDGDWMHQMTARCTRTCLALLALLHEQGPP